MRIDELPYDVRSERKKKKCNKYIGDLVKNSCTDKEKLCPRNYFVFLL